MKAENIPVALHKLIPLVEKWGINDDGYRDSAIAKADTDELIELVQSINASEAIILNEWFCDPLMLKAPSEEYINFSVFFMAFEYAKAVLEDRRSI